MTAKEPYWLYIIWEINGSICRNDSIMLKKRRDVCKKMPVSILKITNIGIKIAIFVSTYKMRRPENGWFLSEENSLGGIHYE